MSRIRKPIWPALEPIVRGRQYDGSRWPRENRDGWISPIHSPLREDRNPSFAVHPDFDGGAGGYKDFATGETGSMADLALKLGVDPRSPTGVYAASAPVARPKNKSAMLNKTTKKPTVLRTATSLEDFASERKLSADRLRSVWGVREDVHNGRRALIYPTPLGVDRVKYIQGKGPKYFWDGRGGTKHWYGLRRALEHGTPNPIYVVNGEPSVWAADQAGVPAVCLAAGEGVEPSSELVFELKATGAEHACVVYDLDEAGRKGAAKVAGALSAGGLDVAVLELPRHLGEGGDVDDLHCSVGDAGLADALAGLQELRVGDGACKATAAVNASAGAEAKFEDMANATSLIEEHGDDLLYCVPLGGWRQWDGMRFAPCENTTELLPAKDVARKILEETNVELGLARAEKIKLADSGDAQAVEAADEAIRRAERDCGRAAKTQGAHRLKAMLSLAAPEVAVGPEALDADPSLFNVANGTVDLYTGRLIPHDRANRITKVAPVSYDPNAQAPVWERTLAEILPDPDVRAFLQRTIGLSLIGEVLDHIYVVLYGRGRNGKGTIIGAIQSALGDYAGVLAASEIIALGKNQSRHPEGKANLRGSRFVVSSEINDNDRLDEAMIKELTGGDTIRAARKYGHEVEIVPTWTLFMQTNHLPKVRGDDEGIWTRIMPVPFTECFTGREDTKLKSKLKEELPGILLWAVEGCLEYQRIGLAPPSSVQAAHSKYRQEEDVLAEWLFSSCEVGQGLQNSQKELHTSFVAWQGEQGIKLTIKPQAFGRQLDGHGFDKGEQRVGNSHVRHGLRLLTAQERETRRIQQPQFPLDHARSPASHASFAAHADLGSNRASAQPPGITDTPGRVASFAGISRETPSTRAQSSDQGTRARGGVSRIPANRANGPTQGQDNSRVDPDVEDVEVLC